MDGLDVLGLDGETLPLRLQRSLELGIAEWGFLADPSQDALGVYRFLLHSIMLALPEQIASGVGWSVNSVRVALTRARGRLRECMERQFSDGGEPR